MPTTEKFCYENLTIISSVSEKSVCCRVFSAIKNVRYKEVSLYSFSKRNLATRYKINTTGRYYLKQSLKTVLKFKKISRLKNFDGDLVKWQDWVSTFFENRCILLTFHIFDKCMAVLSWRRLHFSLKYLVTFYPKFLFLVIWMFSLPHSWTASGAY